MELHADHKMELYSPCAYTSATIGAGGEEYTSEGETAVKLTGPEGKDGGQSIMLWQNNDITPRVHIMLTNLCPVVMEQK